MSASWRSPNAVSCSMVRSYPSSIASRMSGTRPSAARGGSGDPSGAQTIPSGVPTTTWSPGRIAIHRIASADWATATSRSGRITLTNLLREDASSTGTRDVVGTVRSGFVEARVHLLQGGDRLAVHGDHRRVDAQQPHDVAEEGEQRADRQQRQREGDEARHRDHRGGDDLQHGARRGRVPRPGQPPQHAPLPRGDLRQGQRRQQRQDGRHRRGEPQGGPDVLQGKRVGSSRVSPLLGRPG